jgi:hypothetical protein
MACVSSVDQLLSRVLNLLSISPKFFSDGLDSPLAGSFHTGDASYLHLCGSRIAFNDVAMTDRPFGNTGHLPPPATFSELWQSPFHAFDGQ